jgi:hypothetical protein
LANEDDARILLSRAVECIPEVVALPLQITLPRSSCNAKCSCTLTALMA